MSDVCPDCGTDHHSAERAALEIQAVVLHDVLDHARGVRHTPAENAAIRDVVLGAAPGVTHMALSGLAGMLLAALEAATGEPVDHDHLNHFLSNLRAQL